MLLNTRCLPHLDSDFSPNIRPPLFPSKQNKSLSKLHEQTPKSKIYILFHSTMSPLSQLGVAISPGGTLDRKFTPLFNFIECVSRFTVFLFFLNHHYDHMLTLSANLTATSLTTTDLRTASTHDLISKKTSMPTTSSVRSPAPRKTTSQSKLDTTDAHSSLRVLLERPSREKCRIRNRRMGRM